MKDSITPWTWGNKLLGYDAQRKRVWICNQRCHHGAVGIIFMSVGLLLAYHDRKDWPVWFARGMGELS